MTKKKICLISSVAILLVVLCFVAIYLISGNSKVSAAELKMTEQPKTEYSVGEWINVPQGTLTVNGTDYQATSVVIWPDGSATRKSSFELSLTGIYKVNYVATVNGVVYGNSTSFTVVSAVHTNATISLDLGDYSEDALPNAVVGSAYKLFAASAKVGRDSVAEPTTEVFMSYGDHSLLQVEVKNGCFVPSKEGIYKIVYTANNYFDEKTTKTIYITAVDDAKKVTLKTVDYSAVAGESTTLPTPSVTSDGRTGNVTLSAIAKHGDISEEIYYGAYSNDEISYKFEASGTWTIEWTASDYCNVATANSTVTVSVPEMEFETTADDILLEPVFIDGNTYYIPDVVATSYNESGVVHENAEKRYAYDDGAMTTLSGNYLAVEAGNAKTVTIEYACKNLTQKVTVPVRKITTSSDGILSLENLFVTESGAATPVAKGISLDLPTVGTVDFANKLHVETMEIRFIPNYTSGGSFRVSFVDSVNADEIITLQIRFGASSVTISTLQYGKAVTATVKNDEEIRILYKSGANTLTVADSGITLETTGKSFEGFSSGEVFMKISNVDYDGSIVISRINGQRFASLKTDSVAPRLVFNGTYDSMYNIGAQVEMTTARGVDVLDGFCPCYVTVTIANTGEYAKLADGTEANMLDSSKSHVLALDNSGKYRIQYTASDSAGNSASEVMYLQAVNTVAPTIKVGEITQTVAFTGDVLIVPEFNATDAHGKAADTFVIVYGVNGYSEMVLKSYTFTEAGSYKVVLCARDSDGNMSSEYYYVEVVDNE